MKWFSCSYPRFHYHNEVEWDVRLNFTMTILEIVVPSLFFNHKIVHLVFRTRIGNGSIWLAYEVCQYTEFVFMLVICVLASLVASRVIEWMSGCVLYFLECRFSLSIDKIHLIPICVCSFDFFFLINSFHCEYLGNRYLFNLEECPFWSMFWSCMILRIMGVIFK